MPDGGTSGLPEFRARVRGVTETAADAVTGPHLDAYGTPGENFARIAALWSAYLDPASLGGRELTGHDVAMMMVLLKVARNNKHGFDNVVDIIGYAAIDYALYGATDTVG